MNKTSVKQVVFRLLSALALSMGLFSAAAVQLPYSTASADAIPGLYLTAGPPLADISIAKYPGLALGDLDGDGDPDALATDFLGQSVFYRNGGGPNTGASFFREALANYPGGLYIDTNGWITGERQPSNPHPDLYDYDRDGDLDLFIGTWNSGGYGGSQNSERPTILFFRNNGFAYNFDLNNPISRIPAILQSTVDIRAKWITVTVGDLNNDRLPDAVVNYFEFDKANPTKGYFRIKVFLNNSTGYPTMMTPNPIPDVCLNGPYITKSNPRLVDIDKNGRLDLFVGCEDGTVEYYENTGTLAAPAFTQRKGEANPLNPPDAAATLRGPDVGRDAVPAFADMDGDHILDASIVNGAGIVTYYRNTGTLFKPQFTLQQGMVNPLGGLDTGGKNSLNFTGGSALSFGDLDADGDLDAISGSYDGTVHLYLNNGTTTQPQLVEPAGQWGFPIARSDSSNAVPVLVDIDGDGKLDLFVTYMHAIGGVPDGTGQVAFYKNTGTITAPVFTVQPTHALSGITLPINASLSFGNLDGDGDVDLVVGGKLIIDNSPNPPIIKWPVAYYRNDGTAQSPLFVEVTGSENPLDGVDIQFAAPSMVDVDGDGLLDCLIGEGRLYTDTGGAAQNGSVHYFHNTGDATHPAFTEATPLENPFSGLNSGSFATPVLADLDGDADLDFYSGSGFGTFAYSRNVGTRDLPAYRDYQFNPLSNVQPQDVDNPHGISINLGDVDNDGDQDAFIGTAVILGEPSKFLFYLNVGTADEPVFRLQESANNPLRGVQSATSLLNVSFADTDSDGWLEAYVGGDEAAVGYIKYFHLDEASHTVYEEIPGDNPFPSDLPLDYQIGPRLSFMDYNGDSLQDAFVMRGYAHNNYGVYLATNQGDQYVPWYPVELFTIDDWLMDSANPFYYANEHHTIETGMNGSFVDINTIWVGNLTGQVYTMRPLANDPETHANYMVRIPEREDPFFRIYLPSPTLPTAADINADSYMDAFVAASDGRVHFFRGTDTPPPVPNDVFLPLIRR